jgi:starch synthase
MEELLKDDIQFLLLGTGDFLYEAFFQDLAIRYPDKVGVNIAFNPDIERRIYAGADIMFMPSLSEPCGLAQMIACRYATIPIVRATGGLKDTIRDCRFGDGNGFVFSNYDAGELLHTIRAATDMYTYHDADWLNLMSEAMRSDFTWDSSAKAYYALYDGLR